MAQSFPHPHYSSHVLQPAYTDAQSYLFGPMLAAHEAHTIMLHECGIISRANSVALLAAVAQVRGEGAPALDYTPGVEDLFFRMEQQIIARAGADFGGNLQLARSRNDLGHALARMAFREMMLELARMLLALRDAVLAQARQHVDTIMPGYTHTQPAQPVTFAHYLAGVLTYLEKDQARLAAAYANMNESPLGAAALTGSGFAIDRMRVAELLGFDSIIASTQHAIGGGDYLTDAAFAVQSIAINLSRTTHDLLNRATHESGAIRVDDSFIQISSIMPQKRNPVVLEHLRARLSRALGAAQTVVIQSHNIPYGDTQDIEDEIMPPLVDALATLRACLTLYTAFFETVTLDTAHLRQEAARGFTTATELADALVRDAGLPFRQAHSVVAKLVQTAVKQGLDTEGLTLPMLQSAAQEVLGHAVEFSAAQLSQALDAEHFVALRQGVGGVSPQATRALLDAQAERLHVDHGWLQDCERRLGAAEERRGRVVAQLIQSANTNG